MSMSNTEIFIIVGVVGTCVVMFGGVTGLMAFSHSSR